MRDKGRKTKAESRKSWGTICAFMVLPSSLCLLPSVSFAAPSHSQDEVLNSIRENVGQEVDGTKVLAGVAAIVAIGLLVVFVANRQKRAEVPQTLNHPGKLLKEVQRSVNLRPAELRQLKILSEGQDVSSPLVLLLCPSMLAGAIREKADRVDRNVLTSLAGKLRQD